MSFKYEGCIVVAREISGILALLAKKSTWGYFAKVNLNPTVVRKFLFEICPGKLQLDIISS